MEAIEVQALKKCDEWHTRFAKLQSLIVGGADYNRRMLAAHQHALRAGMVGETHDFTEARPSILQLPIRHDIS